MSAAPVTLQVSLAPSDFAHARWLLPHQVAVWRNQVSEILLTVDLHRSAGRFSARWHEGRDHILPLARSIPGARVLEVDYSPQTRSSVGRQFFGNRAVPTKDFRGGPFYSYFFGLHAATCDHVLHTDSDMFFGGGSQHWLTESLAMLAKRSDVFVAGPLPGPPSADGTLRQLRPIKGDAQRFAWDFNEMSTRLFLLDRRRFAGDFGLLEPKKPSARNCAKAWLDGNPPADLPEHLFTARMQDRGFVRHEFLGSGAGMWSLHPPYRTRDFFDRLPELVRRVEHGDLPTAQLGDHDLNESMVDWTEAREALRRNRWWRRLATRAGFGRQAA